MATNWCGNEYEMIYYLDHHKNDDSQKSIIIVNRNAAEITINCSTDHFRRNIKRGTQLKVQIDYCGEMWVGVEEFWNVDW